MAGYNLDDYVDVAERIHSFYERFPDGRLTCGSLPHVVEIGGKPYIWYHARAYRTPDDPFPGDGWAAEPVPGPTQFTKDSELMNAETAAWGRAIVALGFSTNKKIASRQEVQNRQGSQSTGEAKGITPAPEPRNPTPGAAGAAPSPVGSPELGTAAWWDSLRAEQFVQVIGAQSDATTLLRWLTFEGEREMRNGKKPRKGVSVALSKRIQELGGDGPGSQAVPAEPDLGGGPKAGNDTPVSPDTKPDAPAKAAGSSEPASPPKELLLVKAALAWIADQNDNPGLWTVPNVLFGISQRGGGTFGTLEEVPDEWLGRVWEAVPSDVSESVERLGPEALTKLAAQV